MNTTKKQRERRNDEQHYDGVFIGPPAPPSVYYRRSRRAKCASFKGATMYVADGFPKRCSVKRAKAAAWLRRYLRHGQWVSSNRVAADAELEGITRTQLDSAREELKITMDRGCVRRSMRVYPATEWRLPVVESSDE